MSLYVTGAEPHAELVAHGSSGGSSGMVIGHGTVCRSRVIAPECLTGPNRRSVAALAAPSVSAVAAVLTFLAYCVMCTDFVAASCEEQPEQPRNNYGHVVRI